jgi:hypothetical protein
LTKILFVLTKFSFVILPVLHSVSKGGSLLAMNHPVHGLPAVVLMKAGRKFVILHVRHSVNKGGSLSFVILSLSKDGVKLFLSTLRQAQDDKNGDSG